jgi:hypothetical protein
MAIDSEKAVAELQTKLTELTNLTRLIGNCLSIINETNIKGEYAGAVAEVQGWLKGFDASVHNQKEVLQAALPSKEAPKAIEAEVVQ